MIVSHKHKFIFIKTRKTAGTSIEIAISAICGPDDILTIIDDEDELLRKELTGKRAQNYNIPFSKYTFKDWLRFFKRRKRMQFYNHISASEVKKYLDKSIWDNYYKFCFERDPLTKSISHYQWRVKMKNYSNFDAYLNSGDIETIRGDNFYLDNDGNLLVDKIYKMEQMEDAFNEISKVLQLKEIISAPNFSTKKSIKDPSIDKEKINKEFYLQLREIFKIEYKELYNK